MRVQAVTGLYVASISLLTFKQNRIQEILDSITRIYLRYFLVIAVRAGHLPMIEMSAGASKSKVLSLRALTVSEFRWDSELQRVERCLATSVLDLQALSVYAVFGKQQD